MPSLADAVRSAVAPSGAVVNSTAPVGRRLAERYTREAELEDIRLPDEEDYGHVVHNGVLCLAERIDPEDQTLCCGLPTEAVSGATDIDLIQDQALAEAVTAWAMRSYAPGLIDSKNATAGHF